MICIIAGTNRNASRSLAVARLLEKMYEGLGQETKVLDLRELPADLFKPDAYGEKPEAFTQGFIRPILDAQGLHVITPEYNGSFPGILKYCIDMLPFPEAFDGRPVAFTGIANGTFGALRAVEQLQLVFGYRNAYIFPQRVFMATAGNYFSKEGELMDADLVARLKRQAEGFASFAGRVSAQ